MFALMSTAKIIGKFVEARISQHPHLENLSGPRLGVLFIVSKAGSIRMGDLAAKLMVAPRTVTDLVDGLERDGFLRRIPDPRDRRAMLLELTPEMQANFAKISVFQSRFIEEIFSALDEEEQTQLVELLNKLKNGPLREIIEKHQNCE